MTVNAALHARQADPRAGELRHRVQALERREPLYVRAADEEIPRGREPVSAGLDRPHDVRIPDDGRVLRRLLRRNRARLGVVDTARRYIGPSVRRIGASGEICS